MGPAQPHQVVAQRCRQEAHLVAVGLDAERAVALAELRAVRPMNQRNVGIDRFGPAHGLDDLQLTERIVEMLSATDDVRDAHVVVVDDDCQHIGRRTVGAQQDHVVELGVVDFHLALDGVMHDRLAGLRRLQPDHRLHARWRVLRIAVAPTPVVADGLAGGFLGRAHLLEFLRRGVAIVGVADSEHPVRHLGVPRGAGKLEDDIAIPLHTEPGQAVDDGFDGRLGRTGAVGILDAQQELAAGVASIEPVKERGARTADMQEAGRRGGEAGDDGHRAAVM